MRRLVCGLLLAAGCAGPVERELERAQELQQSGLVAESIAVLEDVLEQRPDRPEAHHLMGSALLQSGRTEEAIPHLRRAAASERLAKPSGLLLAASLSATGRAAETVEALDAVLGHHPDEAMALRLRANSQLQLGRLEPALADAGRLVARDPNDFQALILRATALARLGRLDAAEKAFRGIRELTQDSEDPTTAGRGCVLLATFFGEVRGDWETAEQAFDACLERHPGNPIVAQTAAVVFDRIGRADRATAVLRSFAESRPNDLNSRLLVARRLVRTGAADEAEALLLESIESQPGAAPWHALALLYRELGRPADALEAIDASLARSTAKTADGLRFEKLDLLVESGDLAAARTLASEIESDPFRALARGRTALAEGEPEKALDAFDEALAQEPKSALAHYLAARAAHRLGHVERALEGYEAAARIEPGATDGALWAARLRAELGQPEAALQLSLQHIANRGSQMLDCVLLAARAWHALGETERAERALEQWIEAAGPRPRPVLALAELRRKTRGDEAALAVLDRVAIDASDARHEALASLRLRVLIEAGRAEEALEEARTARAAHPDSPIVHALEGRVAAALGRHDAARAAFERSLALDPANAAALQGLGRVALEQGDPEGALRWLSRAEDHPEAQYLAGQVLLAQGRTREAEAKFRAVLARDPLHAAAANDLAWILAGRKQELDLALRLAVRAASVLDAPEVRDTLGYVHYQRGEDDRAVEIYREILAEAGTRPLPGVRYRLGLALAMQGESRAALDAFRTALDAGAFPEREEALARVSQLESSPAEPSTLR